ncbi:MAG: TfoX/Sxy family protein [Holophagaceae bacterium]|nr:TfoX/Sxy family protein [Holophagaceae bacterium]
MGASSHEFTQFVIEQLVSIPGLSTGRFFGGIGVKSEATQFAMIMDGSLFFTVDDESRKKYEQMGSKCFSYGTKKGRVDVRKYFEVPADLLEDSTQLVVLARAAIAVARKAKTSQQPRK